jgi:hypothetical protein
LRYTGAGRQANGSEVDGLRRFRRDEVHIEHELDGNVDESKVCSREGRQRNRIGNPTVRVGRSGRQVQTLLGLRAVIKITAVLHADIDEANTVHQAQLKLETRKRRDIDRRARRLHWRSYGDEDSAPLLPLRQLHAAATGAQVTVAGQPGTLLFIRVDTDVQPGRKRAINKHRPREYFRLPLDGAWLRSGHAYQSACHQNCREPAA